MEITVVIIIVVLVALVSMVAGLSHVAGNLKRLQNRLEKDWTEIEKLQKQRSNQLPRVIQTCRSFLPGEPEAVKAISEARARYLKATTFQDKVRADTAITQALHELFAEAKNFPQLENNNTFIQLQTDLMEIEETIAERRDLFNEDALRFNARLKRIPGKWVRDRARARPRPLFEVEK